MMTVNPKLLTLDVGLCMYDVAGQRSLSEQ